MFCYNLILCIDENETIYSNDKVINKILFYSLILYISGPELFSLYIYLSHLFLDISRHFCLFSGSMLGSIISFHNAATVPLKSLAVPLASASAVLFYFILLSFFNDIEKCLCLVFLGNEHFSILV